MIAALAAYPLHLFGVMVQKISAFFSSPFSYERLEKEVPKRAPQDYPDLYKVARTHPACNRYNDVLPLDATLVQVDGGYCNASWIQKEGEHPLIIAQGPMNPVHFFWRMVHANASVIVNLSDKEQEGVSKYDQYFPPNEHDFEDIHVANQKEAKKTLQELSNEETSPRIIERKFTVGIREENREINHFHLEHWPDHGVVAPELLAGLVRHVMARRTPGKAVVIHCSAGLGRSGVFASLLLAAQQLQDDPSLGQDPSRLSQVIWEAIKKTRQGRDGAIQNEDQYSLIFQTIDQLVKP
jgi:protein tyrosine phosphatase